MHRVNRRSLYLVVSAVLMAAVLMGCANLKTISRRTPLPEEETEGKAVAIHLDAQQRLVLVTAGGYCAEPSPDALSAYAASIGLGTSASGQDAESLALALHNSSGSIGLRTQSITLMRDALYRMCEAANNHHLNALEVAAFLRRSQDLTAVVLAIEQLTGAVAANQVILTPASSAGAAANLVSNQQLLDQAEQNVRTQQEAVITADKRVVETKTERDDAVVSKNVKDQEYEQAKKGATPTEPANEEKAVAEQAEKVLREAEDELANAERDLEFAKQRLKDATEVRDMIRASRDAALTSTAAKTQSSGQFSTPVQRNQLSQGATEAIAKAVTDMVRQVLGQDDTDEICMSYLIRSNYRFSDVADEVGSLCRNILRVRLKASLQDILIQPLQKSQ